MFHSYILAKSGKVIDIGRAQFLMDKALLRRAIKTMEDERDNDPRWDARYDEQWIWGEYCQRHYEKYGEFFIPDVDPNWE